MEITEPHKHDENCKHEAEQMIQISQSDFRKVVDNIINISINGYQAWIENHTANRKALKQIKELHISLVEYPAGFLRVYIFPELEKIGLEMQRVHDENCKHETE